MFDIFEYHFITDSLTTFSVYAGSEKEAFYDACNIDTTATLVAVY